MALKDFDLTPAPAKALLNDVLFNSLLPGKLQNKITFDKDFFQDSDLDFIKKIVKERIKATGKSKGNVENKHYPSKTSGVEMQGGSITKMFNSPEYRVLQTLGQFGYEVKDGKIRILDRFNFNDAPQDRQNIPLSEKLKTFTAELNAEKKIGKPLSAYGKIRKVGKNFGSPEGEGATFKLEIDANN